jgi:hypothetical protein
MSAVDVIWFTRCPVPTATGLAYKLGWLDEEFQRDGIAVRTLQNERQEFGRHHYEHGLPTLIREGGNLLAQRLQSHARHVLKPRLTQS